MVTTHSDQGSDGGSIEGCGNQERVPDPAQGTNKTVEEGIPHLKPGLVRMSQEKVLRHDGTPGRRTHTGKGQKAGEHLTCLKN